MEGMRVLLVLIDMRLIDAMKLGFEGVLVFIETKVIEAMEGMSVL
jgi:hypothetical protein